MLRFGVQRSELEIAGDGEEFVGGHGIGSGVAGGGDTGVFDFVAAVAEDAVGGFDDHFLEDEAEMGAGAEVARGDVLDAVGVSRELIAFAEAAARLVLVVVDGDGIAAVLFHDGEAGHVGGPVAEVDHVRERDGPHVGGHVVVDVLAEVEEAFVDAEEVLRFLSVGDDALGKGDATFAVGGEFAAEDFLDERAESGAVDERLHAAADDVVFEADADAAVCWAEGFLEFPEHFREALVEAEIDAEFFEFFVCGGIHLEVIEERLEIGEFAFPAVLPDEGLAFFPERAWIDAVGREQDLVLHVGWGQRLIVIVDDGDGGLGNGHRFGQRPRA